MNPTVKIKRNADGVWEWLVMRGATFTLEDGAGYCATEADARSDAQTWMSAHCAAPAPDSARELKSAEELSGHGLEQEDFPCDRVWLATWADRSGWYTEGTDNPPAEARFCAVAFNESEIFATAEEAQAWLWARVEVTS